MQTRWMLGLLFWGSFIFSQENYIAKGKIYDVESQKPLENAIISVENESKMVFSEKNGSFEISFPNQQKRVLSIKSNGYQEQILMLTWQKPESKDLGIIQLQKNNFQDLVSAFITINDQDLESNGQAESTSGLLQSALNGFLQAASFQWNIARIKLRGFGSEMSQLNINNISMNELYDGRPQWADWGGLNDAIKNQNWYYGLGPNNESFGGILGTQSISTMASDYRPTKKISIATSNGNFDYRTMFTYASGWLKNDWKIFFTISSRGAKEGFVDGTPFRNQAVFLSIEKKINDRNRIDLTSFYSPSERAKNSAITEETANIFGYKYNPYWGYQDGKIRNAHTKKVEEPIIFLNHRFQIHQNASLENGIMFLNGSTKNGNIDYQNSNSPDPVYYKNMPNYYLSLYENDKGIFPGNWIPDQQNADKNLEKLLENPQIDWNKIYASNTISNTEKQSRYVLFDDVQKKNLITFKSLFTYHFPSIWKLQSSIQLKQSSYQFYKQISDLLGGDYYLDIDPFLKNDAQQSNLNNRNFRAKNGDIYGYHYELSALQPQWHLQLEAETSKINFYFSKQLSHTNYQRNGFFLNGIYPTNSIGKSEKLSFDNFGFKTGFTYKISGNQHFQLHLLYQNMPPLLRNSFANARKNNFETMHLKSESNQSFELDYNYKTPKLKFQISLFASRNQNETSNSFFYSEGIFNDGAGNDNPNGFVGMTVEGMDKQNLAFETNIEYIINANFKTQFSSSVGSFTYTNNPNIWIQNDALFANNQSDNSTFFGKSYLKNYKQGGSPEQSFLWLLEYKNSKYWWLTLGANYFANNYLTISPLLRTDNFVRNPVNNQIFPEATTEGVLNLWEQKKLDNAFVMNLSGGKSWRIGKYQISVFGSVQNLLNNIFQSNGFEQVRKGNYRLLSQDKANGFAVFGPKFFYSNGRTFYLSTNFSF